MRLVAQSCLTLCDPMGPQGSPLHRILQARVSAWVVIFSFRGSSRPRDRTPVACTTCITGRFFTMEPPEKSVMCYWTSTKLPWLLLLWAIGQSRELSRPETSLYSELVMFPSGYPQVLLQLFCCGYQLKVKGKNLQFKISKDREHWWKLLMICTLGYEIFTFISSYKLSSQS